MSGPPDMTGLPDWAGWVAQDADGTWWVYEVEPLEYHRGWYENELGRRLKLGEGPANPAWRKTLGRVK